MGRLRPAPSSPRSPSRSSRRRSTGSRTSWSTRWRSSRPSPTSSTRPLPRCLATKHSHLLPTKQKSYFLFYLQVFASQTRSQVSLRLKLLFNDFSAFGSFSVVAAQFVHDDILMYYTI